MTLQQKYDELLTSGMLQADDAQQHAIAELQLLHDALGVWQRGEPAPVGVYLYGPVGRGKSLVMQLFFDEVTAVPKRRVHFHSFMEELHHRMHTLDSSQKGDPLTRIAQDVAGDAHLLCFDEFYITNIADAMMLGRLFQKLFEQGVTVCATSNWPPESLFQGGVNRDRFMPFIQLILRFMTPLEVAGTQDYRWQEGEALPLFHQATGATGNAWLETVWTGLLSSDKAMVLPADWPPSVRAVDGVLWGTFHDVCGAAYGRDQYLAMADTTRALLLADIPVLGEHAADAALRLVTLVDIFYEAQCPLVCTAEAVPEALCPAGDAAAAFVRTASRLREMQGWLTL